MDLLATLEFYLTPKGEKYLGSMEQVGLAFIVLTCLDSGPKILGDIIAYAQDSQDIYSPWYVREYLKRLMELDLVDYGEVE